MRDEASSQLVTQADQRARRVQHRECVLWPRIARRMRQCPGPVGGHGAVSLERVAEQAAHPLQRHGLRHARGMCRGDAGVQQRAAGGSAGTRRVGREHGAHHAVISCAPFLQAAQQLGQVLIANAGRELPGAEHLGCGRALAGVCGQERPDEGRLRREGCHKVWR